MPGQIPEEIVRCSEVALSQSITKVARIRIGLKRVGRMNRDIAGADGAVQLSAKLSLGNQILLQVEAACMTGERTTAKAG